MRTVSPMCLTYCKNQGEAFCSSIPSSSSFLLGSVAEHLLLSPFPSWPHPHPITKIHKPSFSPRIPFCQPPTPAGISREHTSWTGQGNRYANWSPSPFLPLLQTLVPSLVSDSAPAAAFHFISFLTLFCWIQGTTLNQTQDLFSKIAFDALTSFLNTYPMLPVDWVFS